MRRTPALVIVGTLVAGAVVSAQEVAAGGFGCTEPPRAAPGSAVVIDSTCIQPTVLHARAGAEITWTNRDDFRHVINGANLSWGSRGYLDAGESFSHSFDKPGIYPYSCFLHPGMNGAVVIGQVESSDRAAPAALPGRGAGRSTGYAWARGVGIIVLLVAGGVGSLYALMRTTRGRRQPQP